MITHLAIKNYALINDIEVDIRPGLTIITGETGAGKSILLGAMSLLLGKRADLSIAREKESKCVIEGEFDLKGYGLSELFGRNDLDYDHHTIVRREILPGGKSRAFVNDTPVTVAQLQALGPHLVDVHSQHETLALTSEAFQMEVIDALAGNSELLDKYQHVLRQYNDASREFERLLEFKSEATKELDYNTFLFNELQEAGLSGMDQAELEDQFSKLSHAEEIKTTLARIDRLFGEEQIGTLDSSKEIRLQLGNISGYSADFGELHQRLNSCIIEMEDIHESLINSAENLEVDPMLLEQLNGQLQSLYRLQQKHLVETVEELRSIEEELEKKIGVTLDLDDRITQAEGEKNNKLKDLREVGKNLSERRLEVVPKLKEQLERLLRELGLPNARFKFELTASEEFRSNGNDRLELWFTANKGTEFGLLKKVASGGEMSRIMLAVKAVLIEFKKLPTIIFDEIDTGVSGEIANKIAAIMDTMSRSVQMISITHLPQIAAKGSDHKKVFKEDVDGITVTRLRDLSEEDRVVELAQMIGGEKFSDSAIAHARELLN